MKNCKIDLFEPADYNGQTITHVVVREPTAAEFMEFGEVSLHSRSATGEHIIVEDTEVLARYLEVLIAEPAGLPLDRVCLADGMRLKDAVLDFFGNARRAGLKVAQTASSQNSGGSVPENSPGQV